MQTEDSIRVSFSFYICDLCGVIKGTVSISDKTASKVGGMLNDVVERMEKEVLMA